MGIFVCNGKQFELFSIILYCFEWTHNLKHRDFDLFIFVQFVIGEFGLVLFSLKIVRLKYSCVCMS